MDRIETEKFCVIGAGPCGLAAVKNLKQLGIPVACFEKTSEVGGLWNISSAGGAVCESTQLISSKKLTSYVDFPMPKAYPPYPSRAQALDYLRAYAERFRLCEHIAFDATVEQVRQCESGWEVRISGEAAPRIFRGVIIANGHFSVPNRPTYPGAFSGEILHSHDYVSPERLRGKRVLVVGTGNSGCDIVCDAVGRAERILHSMRHGFYVYPRFIAGRPSDLASERVQRLPLPHWGRMKIYALAHRFVVGRVEHHGLPEPRESFLEGRATIAPHYLHHLGQGAIELKPEIRELEGETVRFADDSAEEVDTIILATGYTICLPFIDRGYLFAPDGRPRLYMHVFHPEHHTLFAVGLVNLNGGFWRIADYQAQLIARFVAACDDDARKADRLRASKADRAPEGRSMDGMAETDPSRNIFVDYYRYRARLKRMLSRLGHAGETRSLERA